MRKNNGFGDTKAIIHQLDDINIYQVTGEQLEILSGESNSDLYLEFGICCISVFASFLCSLIVLDFDQTPKAFNFYFIVVIIMAICACALLALWYRNRKSKVSIIDKIKKQKIINE